MDENGLPFVVSYTVIENDSGAKSTGKSLGIRLNRDMYRFIREGGSLNKIIDNLKYVQNNKQK